MSERPHALPLAHFPHFETIDTRWMDNDVYGHLNNVVHYLSLIHISEPTRPY